MLVEDVGGDDLKPAFSNAEWSAVHTSAEEFMKAIKSQEPRRSTRLHALSTSVISRS